MSETKARPQPVQQPPALVALREKGVAAQRAGEHEKARDAYAAYLAAEPRDGGIWSNLGALLRGQGEYDLALAAHRRAEALDPEAFGVRNNLANLLGDIGLYDEALRHRVRLAAEQPENIEAQAMVGKTLRAMRRHDESVAALEAAHAARPDHPETQIQLSLSLLAAGRYEEGFRHYAARWQTGELTPRNMTLPQWEPGTPLKGKRILVLPEQGFGDAVTFLRFLPVLRRYKPKEIILSIERPLARLLAGVEGPDRQVTVIPAEGYDLWTNMMDLPGLHFAAAGEIPPPTRLTVPEDARARARTTLAPYARRFKVGVVWTGSLSYRGNNFRSFPHRELHALLDVPNLQLFSLYKGSKLKDFSEDGTAGLIPDLGGSERDFADNAAMMEEMDLVISSDTATVHVAGSLGVPIWTLLHWDAFWLWQRAEETTPWYPGMRLVRQKAPRDWAEVFARIRPELTALAAAKAAR